MKKQFIYTILLLLIFSFAVVRGNSSEPFQAARNQTTQVVSDKPLCGVQSDVRYYFLDEGLYEFSVADASTGSAKYSVCIEGTEASGRCKEDNFNVPWKFYVDKGLSISVWRSVRRKEKDENGKIHSVYGAPEETTIVKDKGEKNWKNWKGNLLRWQEADATGRVVFTMNIKVKKIK